MPKAQGANFFKNDPAVFIPFHRSLFMKTIYQVRFKENAR